MEVEMEVDAGVPQAGSAELKSLKRKVIRVRIKETQDCGMLATSPEEAEELAFVRSALGEPRGALTVAAVRMRSDTGSLRRWWLKKV